MKPKFPITIKLERESIDTLFRDDDWYLAGTRRFIDDAIVCGKGVEEVFEVPEECDRMDLVISNRKLAQSYRFEAEVGRSGFIQRVHLYLGDQKVYQTPTLSGLDDLIERYGMYNGYVQVQI